MLSVLVTFSQIDCFYEHGSVCQEPLLHYATSIVQHDDDSVEMQLESPMAVRYIHFDGTVLSEVKYAPSLSQDYEIAKLKDGNKPWSPTVQLNPGGSRFKTMALAGPIIAQKLFIKTSSKIHSATNVSLVLIMSLQF